MLPEKEILPDPLNFYGRHYDFSIIFFEFRVPVREVYAKSGSENRKNGIMRRLPDEFPNYPVNVIYFPSFKRDQFLSSTAISGLRRDNSSDRETRYLPYSEILAVSGSFLPFRFGKYFPLLAIVLPTVRGFIMTFLWLFKKSQECPYVSFKTFRSPSVYNPTT